MDRLVLLVVACLAQVGCQTQTYDFTPFSIGRQTRVPPPPTGAVGNSQNIRFPTPAPPPANAGAYLAPDASYGTGRYWETAADPAIDAARQNRLQRDAVDARSLASTQPPAASNPPALRPNDRLSWRDPGNNNTLGAPVPSYREFAAEPIVGTGASYATYTSPSYASPRAMPAPQNVSPIVSAPPRIRSFPSSHGNRRLVVPQELADIQNYGVRQASASTNWQSPDELRR